MIFAALQSTRFVTSTTERPINASCAKLTTMRTLPRPGRRTLSVKHQEVFALTVTGRYAVARISGTNSSTALWGLGSFMGQPLAYRR
jgi:hypothetical protein